MRTWAYIALLFGLAGGEANADRIEPIFSIRIAFAYSLADFGVTQTDSQLVSARDRGVFDGTANALVQSSGSEPLHLASATARQVSIATGDSLHAEGSVLSSLAPHDAKRVFADAHSQYRVRFRIGAPQTFHIAVRLNAGGGIAAELVVANMLFYNNVTGMILQLESRCQSLGACDGIVELRRQGLLLPAIYELRVQARAAGEAINSTPSRNLAASFLVDFWLDREGTGVERAPWGTIKALYRGAP